MHHLDDKLLLVLTGVMQNGNTCLHKACMHGRPEVAKYLCECGGKELMLCANKVS